MTIIKRSLLRTILLASLPVAIAAGCADTSSSPEEEAGGKPDRWNTANDPANMGRNYEYNWDELNVPDLQAGASEIVPWPDTYWPMKGDGYNNRWQGDSKPSSMELYDQVFNDWAPSMGMDAFLALKKFSHPGTAYDGEYYEEYGPATEWAHNGGNERARVLTDPDGTSKWDEDDDDFNVKWGGLEGWYGHCHAWAPAAIMVPEPQHAVTYEGVTFEVADIKALAEATFEGGRSMFLGGRCNAKDAERDEHGRIIATECRDTNAGAFHVVTVNRIGVRKASFVIDATYDFQVWNQPVRDYEIKQQNEVDLSEALTLVGRTDVTDYPYNPDAKRFVHVEMDFRYVVEGSASASPYLDRVDSFTTTHNYDYLLELETDGTIIGGEWIDDAPHPDFIWAPYGSNDIRSKSAWGGWGQVVIEKAKVQKLIDLSIAEDEVLVEGEETVFESAPARSIPDNDDSGVKDTISVPDSVTIAGLRVDVDITHTYRGDLKVELVRAGKRVLLSGNEGGGQDDLIKTFSVTDFNDEDAVGRWVLEVRDTAGADTGTLNTWSLTVIEAD